MINRIPIDDTGCPMVNQEALTLGIHLLAPYEQDVKAGESCDKGKTITRQRAKAIFGVEQYKAGVAHSEDHRDLVC